MVAWPSALNASGVEPAQNKVDLPIERFLGPRRQAQLPLYRLHVAHHTVDWVHHSLVCKSTFRGSA